jgi:hypothetical protein
VTRSTALAALLGAALLLTASAPAAAQTTRVASYAYEQVYPAAVRFLRIDQGYDVVEHSAEAGYVLFDLAEDGKKFRGALELVRIQDDDGRAAVRLVLRVADRPGYIARLIMERLERKLRAELGDPPPPPPAERPAAPSAPEA